MKYIDFKEKFAKFLVFSLQDIKKEEPDFYRANLTEWQKKGYIKKVVKEYYIFSDLNINEKTLFIIANKIYSPSYISLEMALSHYGVIPESVYSISSVTTKKTRKHDTDLGLFMFNSIKKEIMFGYRLEGYRGHKFKIAEIEKALLDYLYLNSHLKTDNDFYEIRFNAEVFKEKFDLKKLEKYVKLFSNKSLKQRVNKFLIYYNLC